MAGVKLTVEIQVTEGLEGKLAGGPSLVVSQLGLPSWPSLGLL